MLCEILFDGVWCDEWQAHGAENMTRMSMRKLHVSEEELLAEAREVEQVCRTQVMNAPQKCLRPSNHDRQEFGLPLK